ncbi:hypothetical protein [Paracoccus suum]|uniref:hypothetical protein n=1 Tax=Paracoccus suum TaxID=2259340 RepID=UPI0013B064A8|nr:hypothetical protein [Paracoccus suum]
MTRWWRRWRKPALDIGLIAALLLAVSFLPPDTSLAERRKQRVLRFCVPDLASPLVAADQPGAPGPELRQMQAVAARLGLPLQTVAIANMGRSFNPRDWQIGRGQCDIIGGGLADSSANRDFLTLLPNGGRIAMVRAGPAAELPKGAEIGVFMGSAGLDRLRLSGWLRAQGWRARPLATQAALDAYLRGGGTALASTLTPLPPDTKVADLPPEAAESQSLAFGLWRGDVTLTRAVRRALSQTPAR